MKISILQKIQDQKAKNHKSLALLIDPDKFDENTCQQLADRDTFSQADFIFVGGSLINGSFIHQTIALIRGCTERPIIIFPGNSMHVDLSADGILFLSLISGRNPDFLIGQHVVAAPFLKKSNLEVLPTGYMLIESGRQTTVSYISNTTPLPYDKPEVAVCTAMAGEMLGLKMIYADAGSGAQRTISTKMVQMLYKALDIPLMIGGGIRSAQAAADIFRAGADVIVVGNGAEGRPELIQEIRAEMDKMNGL